MINPIMIVQTDILVQNVKKNLEKYTILNKILRYFN